MIQEKKGRPEFPTLRAVLPQVVDPMAAPAEQLRYGFLGTVEVETTQPPPCASAVGS